jgi:hypothetical protein
LNLRRGEKFRSSDKYNLIETNHGDYLKSNFKDYLDGMKNDIFYNILLDKNITDSKEDLLFFSSFDSQNIETIFIKF